MSEYEKLAREIRELCTQKQAVILAHNYQRAEVQDIADFTGDSLGLSREAARTDAQIIVFCGVHFMAQTAKLLSPDKTVLLPQKAAGCPMADMIDPESLREFKAEHPGAPVVAYVNTTAEVKAESDICCTSSNAVAVVRSLKAETILFVPDQHLGRWVAKHVPEKRIILYGGFCPVHHSITPDIVADAKRHHPQAVVMAHPECPEDTLALADVVLSTGGMLDYAQKSEAREFIVVTEFGIVHPLQKENPDKLFHQISSALCPNMKLTTLESVKRALVTGTQEITIDPEVARKARQSVERMVQIG